MYLHLEYLRYKSKLWINDIATDNESNKYLQLIKCRNIVNIKNIYAGYPYKLLSHLTIF